MSGEMEHAQLIYVKNAHGFHKPEDHAYEKGNHGV